MPNWLDVGLRFGPLKFGWLTESRTPGVRLKVPAAGCVTLAVKYLGEEEVVTPPAKAPVLMVGEPLRFQNCPSEPQPKLPYSPTPAKSALVPMPHGVPVWNCVVPEISHPPSSFSAVFFCPLKNGRS